MRQSVSDLLGHPGTSRSLERQVTRADVGLDEVVAGATGQDPSTVADDDSTWGPADEAVQWPLDLDVSMDSVVEGILVRGTVAYTAGLPCARCLDPVEVPVDVDVAELYRDPNEPRLEDGDEVEEGYVIDTNDRSIDLETLLRDAVVMNLPVRALCDDACEGLCPVCGVARRDGDCGHDATDTPDPRWAKLADLHLDDAGTSRN